jgi:hypothetical protein
VGAAACAAAYGVAFGSSLASGASFGASHLAAACLVPQGTYLVAVVGSSFPVGGIKASFKASLRKNNSNLQKEWYTQTLFGIIKVSSCFFSQFFIIS